jgi:hypothetical protein
MEAHTDEIGEMVPGAYVRGSAIGSAGNAAPAWNFIQMLQVDVSALKEDHHAELLRSPADIENRPP